MTSTAAGIDIGGTNIAIALAHADGDIVAKQRFETQVESGPSAVLEKISTAIDRMIVEEQFFLEAIGVGSPAPIDINRGLIMSPSNLRGWSEFPIVDLLKERFGVPVQLENDANAAALGEYTYGAGRGHKNLFYITVSTGVGGGVIVNGELYHGVATAAGEIGHTIVQPDGTLCNCGSIGCLETICSGLHIARRARERLAGGEASLITDMVTSPDEITARIVVDAVRQGDLLASSVWDETCHYLSIGIANAISLLAPEVVIVGGGVAAAGELLFAQLRARVPGFVSMVPSSEIRIVPAELGLDSGVYGAVSIACTLLDSRARTTYAS
jgi:glucokinase